MNEMLRRDVPGFDQAAPTLRSEQVMAACQALLEEEPRRPSRPMPIIAVVEAPHAPETNRAPVGTWSPIAPPPPGATVLEAMAREVTAALVVGLLGMARRAVGPRWS